MTLPTCEVVIGTGFTRFNGIFIVNKEFQTNCRLKVDLLHVGGGAQQLAINVGADDHGGDYTHIGTYRDLRRSIEPCRVGDHPAIRFNLDDQTLTMRKRFVTLTHMQLDHTDTRKCAAASPDIVRKHGMQPVDAWAVVSFGSESARDAAYCKIFGDGLLGAVHRLPISENSVQRCDICRALGMGFDGNSLIQRFAFDPRPPRIDSTTRVRHLPHDPYWIQSYVSLSSVALDPQPVLDEREKKRQRDAPDSPDSLEGL